jgi:hypothetical protein
MAESWTTRALLCALDIVGRLHACYLACHQRCHPPRPAADLL